MKEFLINIFHGCMVSTIVYLLVSFLLGMQFLSHHQENDAVNFFVHKASFVCHVCMIGSMEQHYWVKGMDIFKALDTFRTGVIPLIYRWGRELRGEKTCLRSWNKSVVLTWRTQSIRRLRGGWGQGMRPSQMPCARSDCPLPCPPVAHQHPRDGPRTASPQRSEQL